MKQPVLRDKHFYILLVLFIAFTVFYYFGELVILLGWEALRWQIFYTVHDPHRMLFLVPILYSSYYYRLRGTLLANVISVLIFLPRAFFISPYPDATLRMFIFVIVAIVISVLAVLIFNERDKLNKVTEALKQSEVKNRGVVNQMFDSYYEMDLAGNFTFVNDSVCRNLGYSREELIGNNYRFTVPEQDIKPLLLAFNEVFRTREPNKGFEHKIRRRDGSIMFVETSISPRKNEKGEIIGFRSVSRDVTERKQAEEKIKSIAAEWQITFDSITDLVSIQDSNSKLVRVNKAYADTFHAKPEDLVGRYCYEIVHETLCPIDNCPHQQALKTRTSITSEIFEPRLGVFLEESCSPIFNELGEIAGTVHIAKNINERKQAEEALQREKEFAKSLVDTAQTSIVVLDKSGHIITINHYLEQISGYLLEEVKGKNWFSTFLPEAKQTKTGELFLTAIGDIHTKGNIDEIVTKDGRIRSIEWYDNTLKDINGDIVGLIAIGQDITERKRAEEELRSAEEKYRSLVENINDLFYTLDTEGNITYMSPVVERFTLYKVSDLIGKPFIPLVYPDDLPGLLDSFNRLVSGQLEPWEFRVVDKDGRIVFVRTSSRPVYEDGKIVGITGLMTDITERKHAEEALHNAEEKYRSLVENISDIFYMLDNQGNITYISPVVERLTRYKVSELIGKPVFQLIHPDDLPGLLDSYNHLVAGQLVPWEFRLLDKDSRILFVHSSRQLLYKDGKVIGVTALITDITERKQMEKKLEELATHDFLTGLPNRVLLLDRFTIAVALAHRNKARLAVMVLDLDKFKLINDIYGHGAGDQVLKVVGTRLTGIIRASDTLARLGGDEFVLVMMETDQMKDATAIAQKILDSFKEPLLIDGNDLLVSTSIGIAIYPEDGQDLESLIKKSDAAMYYSKGHGRNQFKFFSDGDVQVDGDHENAE
ncbi:MAG: PAS domain S-box protein [Dehalococcoidia bacterium]